MYNKIVSKIVEELKSSKYYSISVDSTPDITHHDQLTFIVRYVLNNGCPTERFLKFIRMENHTAAEMETTLLNFEHAFVTRHFY